MECRGAFVVPSPSARAGLLEHGLYAQWCRVVFQNKSSRRTVRLEVLLVVLWRLRLIETSEPRVRMSERHVDLSRRPWKRVLGGLMRKERRRVNHIRRSTAPLQAHQENKTRSCNIVVDLRKIPGPPTVQAYVLRPCTRAAPRVGWGEGIGPCCYRATCTCMRKLGNARASAGKLRRSSHYIHPSLAASGSGNAAFRQNLPWL
jgi:hypothetical protein